MAKPFKFRYVNEIVGSFVLVVLGLAIAGFVLTWKAQGWFERAYKLFRVHHDSMGVFLTWSRIVDAISYGFESLELLDAWIEEFKELMRDEFFQQGRLGTRVPASMTVALLMRKSADPDIEHWAELALVDTGDKTDLDSKLNTLAHMSFYYLMYKGDFKKASFAINSSRFLR